MAEVTSKQKKEILNGFIIIQLKINIELFLIKKKNKIPFIIKPNQSQIFHNQANINGHLYTI